MSPSEFLMTLHEANRLLDRKTLETLPDEQLGELYKAVSRLFWAIGAEETTRRLDLRKILATIPGTEEYEERAHQADRDEYLDEQSGGGQRYKGR
jgi:hypothetical protein